jgi:anti-sigma regulatory factor (Ser/Thr protein kinase)
MPLLHGIPLQRRHSIRESSAIGTARRDSQQLAAELNLDETASAQVGVVVTELATNVLRHAGAGEILLQGIAGPDGAAIEIVAIDRGRGMRDIGKCLRDGYSSAGTPGNGLGAVKRLSGEFDISSVLEKGTVVMSRIGHTPSSRFGAICAAREGEVECGDTWRFARNEAARSALVVIDGLGHGPGAAEAAHRAATSFVEQPFDGPRRQIERTHQALMGSRGAAVACAAWNGTGTLTYAGVGNISGRLWSAEGSRGLVSHNGTLGYQMHRVQEFDYPLSNGALLIMHSDGLSARWDLDDHVGLRHHHPALIAATLYRDHLRGRDDATVVVVSV